MQVGHNYLVKNFNPEAISGFLSLRGYQISPDKGLEIICFNTEQNLKKNLPELKKVFSDYQEKFNCMISFEKGVENKEMLKNNLKFKNE